MFPFIYIDRGTGASLIYPILGYKLYGWNFLATGILIINWGKQKIDINEEALENAQEIINKNNYNDHIIIRKSNNVVFKGLIQKEEK